jgi:MFS transporter, FHS family, glucose/mannose:H+ symporter
MIWPFIILGYFSLFVFGLADNIRGPLFPDILREFSVNDSVGSLMFALSSGASFTASHFARHFLRRFERRSVLQAAALALGLALIGMAAAPFFPLFLLFSVCFGFSMGIVGLIPNILVPLGSKPERKQQMLSGLHAMYGVASLIAPLLAASLGLLTGSWRWTFALSAIVPFSLLAYSFHGSHGSLHKKQPLPADHAKSRRKNIRPQLFLALMVSFSVAAEVMVSSRLALYMRREWNYDLEGSSLYVTYFFIFLLLGRLLFAVIPFRQSIRLLLSLSIVFAMGLFFLGLFVHPLFLAATGFAVAPFYPLAISWISSEFPHDMDAAVSYMIATDSMMLILMHLLVGRLTDAVGIAGAILTGPVFLLGSLLMVNSFGYFFRRSS